MHRTYERDLDLNLLRVFVVVAEAGSVTVAADRLYLTQPAVSAALRRLAEAVGAPLFARAGRGLILTTRGQRLLEVARPHLQALVEAAVSPLVFDPKTSDRILRLGLADITEAWLLPPLLRTLSREAPRLRVVVLPVQFRTVAEALSSGAVEVAVTVADELPAGTRRQTLFHGSFVALYDPRHTRLGPRPSLARYLAHEHLIVSFNGDLRGVVEDALGIERRIRVSLPSFHAVGSVLEGSALLATVPEVVARELLQQRPQLKIARLPLPLVGTPMEMLWRSALDDDPAIAYLRGLVVQISAKAARGLRLGASPSKARPRALGTTGLRRTA